MAAMVLNSTRATEMSIYVVRAFIKMRAILGQHEELAQKLSQLEQRVSGHDGKIRVLVHTIRQLMEIPKRKPRKVGF